MAEAFMYIAYIAGLLDGEGSFQIQKRKARPGHPNEYPARISIANTCRSVLEEIQKRFAGSIYEVKPHRNRLGKKKCWTWVLSGKPMERVVQVLLPYLWIKKKQAELLLQFRTRIQRSKQRLHVEEVAIRDAMWLQMKELNHAPR